MLFLAIFRHNKIYQGLWEKAGPILQCIVVLQSRGQGHKKGTDLSNSFQVVQHFPINPDTYANVGKLLNNTLIYGCSPIQGDISNS